MTDSRSRLGILLGKIAFPLVYKKSTNFQDAHRIEQARAFRTLLTVNNLTQAELAKQLGVSQTTIAMALPLLDLPEEVQDSVARGELAASTAYKIASKVEDPEEQRELAARVVAEDLTRSQADEMVRERVASSKPAKVKGRGVAKAKGKVKIEVDRTLKAGNGYTVIVARKKGIDLLGVLEALRDATRQVQDELAPADEDAA
jgi:ParB-like chromosome segregation protein Spo0J